MLPPTDRKLVKLSNTRMTIQSIDQYIRETEEIEFQIVSKTLQGQSLYDLF